MNINIDIPDWVEKESRGIYIMAGNELVASKMPFEKYWKVKVSRCSMCGKCCEKRKCPYLGEDKMCKVNIGKNIYSRPFVCCIAEPKNIPECTSKMEIVK